MFPLKNLGRKGLNHENDGWVRRYWQNSKLSNLIAVKI